jgi:hypothetical protein
MQNFQYIDELKEISEAIDTRFNGYVKQFEDDLPALGNTHTKDIPEEAMKLAKLRSSYLRLANVEENNLYDVEKRHKKVIAVLKKFYAKKLSEQDTAKYGLSNMDEGDLNLILNKAGVDDLIQANDLYREATKAYGKQVNLLKIINDQITFLKDRGFHVNTAAHQIRHNNGSN